MTKKLTCLAMALCLALGLTACGGAGGDAGSDQFSTDLSAFYETVASGAEFPMMVEITGDMVDSTYPGLAEVERTQSVLYMAGISAVACEIAMVEVADAGDVETVKEIFQTRIDAQVDGGAWYPDTIDQWQNNAEIIVRDNYVCLFVVPDGMDSPSDAFSAL